MLTLKGLRQRVLLQYGSEGGNCTSDLPIVSVNSHASSVMPGGGRRVADASSIDRSQSAELVRTIHFCSLLYLLYKAYVILCDSLLSLQTFE